MVTVRWRIRLLPGSISQHLRKLYQRCALTFYSLTYNHHMGQSYAADVCMEPIFWFVDNFTSSLGPFFVVSVSVLTTSVVLIAYWLGIPYWWERSPAMCVLLVAVGHWILANVAFHYYMGVTTAPGQPPEGRLIQEAVSICKKCIAPKPPRTHHCSVCNRCILKMDHHCPWLNNCVGFHNHRYFFMYMAYMVLGVAFLIVFGVELAYHIVWLEDDEPELDGHPVKFSQSGALIPVTEVFYLSLNSSLEDAEEFAAKDDLWRRRAIMYMALINVGVLVSLGGLSLWHARLIGRGETSIEANINKAETARLAAAGVLYRNPYDFGTGRNWRLFLGLVDGRSWLRHVLLPSAHSPPGDGLTWPTVHDATSDHYHHHPPNVML